MFPIPKNSGRVNSVEQLPKLKNFFIKPSSAEPISKNSYQGKLIIRAESDKESSPRVFNLFRVTDAQISLAKILEECSIIDFEKFAGIIIKPSANGIFIENDSTCTITKQNILMTQDKPLELFYNDSIIISPEYVNSTLVLTLESLKPN